jgi:hypothetical protein
LGRFVAAVVAVANNDFAGYFDLDHHIVVEILQHSPVCGLLPKIVLECHHIEVLAIINSY